MTEQLKITDLDLSAYIDGELDAERMRAVEEAVSRDERLAARIAAYRADKDMLKNIYAPLADDPLPPAWIDLARAVSTPAPARHSWRLLAAAALVVAALGGLSIFDASRQPAGDVVEAALAMRHDAETPVAVASLGDARHHDAALRSIVGARIHVPALDSLGYYVTGLKLHARAAEIEYRDRTGRLFTVYLSPSDGKTRFDQFERAGLHICVWQDDRITTVMAGRISATMMQRLASLTYLGLAA